MTGIVELRQLLKNMQPILSIESFVFCSLTHMSDSDIITLKPISIYKESEGTTIVINERSAIDNGLSYEGIFKKITLQVHSSLNAIGLTAAVATALTKAEISANVIAAFHHDHIFVPSSKANLAMDVLTALTEE